MTQLFYENELIPAGMSKNEDAALIVANAGDYLPRLKLCQPAAKEVTHRKVSRGGNYALIRSKDEIEDLGEEVEMVVCAGRPKALQTGDVIISIFEPDSDEFKRIQSESKNKDSGCMYGPEYLVWLPNQDTFATLFMCNPTARREAGSVHARLRKAALLTSNLIETEKYSWYGPVCKDLTTPITNLPASEIFQEEIGKFENEKSSQVKSADADEGDRER